MANNLLSLSLDRDFKRLFKQGFIFKKKEILIRYYPNECGKIRLAFSIPKTQIKHAVKRNKIKRWSKEILRLNSKTGELALDVLIKVNKGMEEYEKLKIYLEEWIEKAEQKTKASSSQ